LKELAGGLSLWCTRKSYISVRTPFDFSIPAEFPRRLFASLVSVSD